MTNTKICVVGIGKIGLPLAVQMASKGHMVTGADIDQGVVDRVNKGETPFVGEADLPERLREAVGDGRLLATTDTTAAVAGSAVVVVAVPLIVDTEAQPDFGALDAATTAIAGGLQPGTLVSYETTLPVHTTRRRFAPALARTGLTLGEDFFLCHSPERVYSGRIFADLRRYPKLIGACDAPSARRAVEFYESVLDFDARPDLSRPNGVWDLGSAEAAELTKLVETTYRDVNIALANEFARHADRIGVDLYGVIAAANSQPYSHVHQPGVAVGGHCIPVYPRLYLAGDPDAGLPALARRVNESMPAYAVARLERALDGLGGRTVVVLGASYRGDVKELAFSGVFPLVAALEAGGATARVHDPLYSDTELARHGLAAYRFGDPCDGAIVQADHHRYRTLQPADLPGIRVLLDGRRCTDPALWSDVERILIGSPDAG